MFVVDLGLDGLVTEWNSFVTTLNNIKIKLTDEDDTLVWSWNKGNGQLNAKMSYDAMSFSFSDLVCKWWYKRFVVGIIL